MRHQIDRTSVMEGDGSLESLRNFPNGNANRIKDGSALLSNK
jgi:hypothetical protein